MINKEHRGIRTGASRVAVSYQTVANVMKKSGAKPYHKYRAHKLSQAHKERRVTFSKWMLKNFGSPRAGRNLGLLINTDFSAKIRVNPTRNSKNDVVWATSRGAAGDILECQEEKYSVGDMIWGGISWKGLVPSESPVFMSDFYKNYNPVSKNMNGAMYADLERGYAAPAVEDLYPEGDAIWQDDPASIHRCTAALAAVNDSFNRRLDHEVQCLKFSDVWQIENVWGIVKERASQQKCETLAQLKRAIIGAWRSSMRTELWWSS